MKNFDEWIAGFRESIAGYKYYADFPKVFGNVDGIRIGKTGVGMKWRILWRAIW